MNASLRSLAALALAAALTVGLNACTTEPEDGVVGGSSTPSIDGVWLGVKLEYAMDYIMDGEIYEDFSDYDTVLADTADVYARNFLVIRDGAMFQVAYEGDSEFEETNVAVTRVKSVGGNRWAIGMNDTVEIVRKGGALSIEWRQEELDPEEEEGYVGSVRQHFVAYKGSFPPEEWFIDPTLVYEPDGTRLTAKPIVVGQIQERYLVEDDFDWFSFEAKKGETYDLWIESFDVETEVRLYDRNGTTLLDSDNNYISWECPTSGTYYFRVGNEGFGEGAYQASVSKVTEVDLRMSKAGKRAPQRVNPLRSVPLRTHVR